MEANRKNQKIWIEKRTSMKNVTLSYVMIVMLSPKKKTRIQSQKIVESADQTNRTNWKLKIKIAIGAWCHPFRTLRAVRSFLAYLHKYFVNCRDYAEIEWMAGVDSHTPLMAYIYSSYNIFIVFFSCVRYFRLCVSRAIFAWFIIAVDHQFTRTSHRTFPRLSLIPSRSRSLCLIHDSHFVYSLCHVNETNSNNKLIEINFDREQRCQNIIRILSLERGILIFIETAQTFSERKL